jgi:hypothetical protein
MSIVVDVVMVAVPVGLWLLVRAQARANLKVTRRPGFIIGGPHTRQEDDRP